MKFVFTIILFLLSFKAVAYNSSIPYIKKAIQEMILDSRMDYETILKMPDGTVHSASGVMAFKGSNFYDSSSTRFIFYNESWYIGADHTDKTIKVYSMKAWKKQYGALGKLDIFNYMMDEDSTFFDKAKFDLEALPNDNYYLHIVFNSKESMIQKLNIKYNIGSRIPLEYSGEVLYPVEYKSTMDKVSGEQSEQPSTFATLKFYCKNIARVNPQLFNHKRLIDESRKEAHLLRYNNYQTIYIKKPKK